MKKRILSILLAALMLLSAVPLGMVDTAWAISSRDTVVDSGTCGGTLNNSQLMKWTLTSDGTLTISGEGNMFGAPWSQYKSKIKKVVIGEGVESISDNAFHYYENLRSVSLPSTLTSIGEAAFWACSSLQSITLPNNLTNIGLNAFRACHSLTQVLIPASVTSIDGSAFECCTGLTDVVFEGNSLEFGSGATFYDCTSLKNVFFNGTRADWTASRGSSGSVLPAAAQIYYKNDLISSGTCGDNSSGNNTQWKLTKAGTLIITVGTGYTEGGIADFAYGKAPWYQDIYDSGIRCLIIGSGIKTIGSYAFADCTDLAEIIVPDGVISIGNGAFLQNSGAKRVVLPPSTVYIGHGALRDCSALTSVSLPDSMSNRLFLDMFEGCTNLKSVDIPDGITDICEGDLASCPNWTDIYYDNWGRVWNRVVSNVRDSIPDRMNVHFKDNIYDSGSCGENVTWTLTADGTLTISGTGAMTDYTYDSRSPWYSCRAYIKRVVIQQGVRAIGDYAFYYCENLTSVTIPDSVTSIGDYAFAYCVSLTSATIPEGVTSIGGDAFLGCTGLTSVAIPSSVTSTGFETFSGCTRLTSITIPEGVTSIGNYAFKGCSGLTSVTIPDSVTSIGGSAFSGCSGLTSVTIPSSVTSIGWSAFENCTALTFMTIPESVTYISGEVFSNCIRLAKVTIPKSVTSIGKNAFYYCESIADVYYDGTEEDWAKISISEGNEDLLAAALHCKPTPLTAPSVTGGNDSQGRPTLKWDKVAGAAKYEVYRARSKDGDYIKYSTQTSTGYTNSAYLTSGSTYYYKVRALDANGTAGPWSDVVAVTCRLGLTAPSVTGGNDSQGRPTLKWDKVAGAAKYEVYRSYSQNGNYSKYSTQTSTGYTNSSYLTSGSKYYYKVRALDANGTAGAWSSIVSVTYKQTLSAPAVTGGNDSQGRPTLKWNAVTGAAKYEVYRARSKDGDYIKYSTQTSTGYTNSAYLTSGSTYYYKVRALDANGTAGAWSSVVSVTYKQTLPAPTVTGGNDAQGRPTLTWNAVTGAAKYEVYRARSRSGEYIKYSTVTGTSYTNTSYIENGNTYYYKVRALDANGTAGAWSSIVSVTYRDASTGTLSAPTVTGGNDSQGRPTLKWNAVSGAAKYEVYRARSKDGDYIKYSTITGTSYTNISYIENGNTYYYKVRALDANGTAGAWGSIVSVTYKQTLPAPTVTGGNDAQGRPTLKWNAVSGAAKYEVYRARSRSGEYIKYSTVTGTSYTNTSYIEDGNTYYYKVRALDASGTAGAWSSIVSVTYRAASTGTLPAPTVTGGNDAQGRPTLTWNAVTGAAKYEVYRARSQSGDYIKYSTVTGTSYTNTSYIEDGNTYYYKVRALDANGTAGAWGSIVSVTYRAASTGTLSAPTVTGGNDAQGRPTLKWNAVTGAAKYEVYRARSLNGDYIKYSTVTGTSYTNTSYIENGNTYYYKVRALKSDGTAGAWSSIVSVTYRKPAAATVASGKCGDSAKWTLDAAGTLTISGSGRMYDYEWPADRGGTTPPWLANKYRDSIRALRVEQGITYIGRCAFDSCSNLSDVTLPTSLRIIGQCAFNDCTALRSIQLPEGLTTIMEDAFNAAGLVSITFPSTLGELRDGAFMNCEKLQSLRLPEGLTTIGNWAFYCNPNISSIYIPASVTTIGEEAFIYYNNLATVRYGGSQSQWSAVSVAANAFPDGVRYVYNVN